MYNYYKIMAYFSPSRNTNKYIGILRWRWYNMDKKKIKIISFKKKKNGGDNMSTIAVSKSEEKNNSPFSDIRKIIQSSMREKGVTSEEVRRALAIKRYEKK